MRFAVHVQVVSTIPVPQPPPLQGDNRLHYKAQDFLTENLGENRFPTPLELPDSFFASTRERVLYCNTVGCSDGELDPEFSFERPGPFHRLHFDPAETNVGIVTCGGLCPGINDVIRSITYSSLDAYKVSKVYGFRHGFAGLARESPEIPIELCHDVVHNIHEQGGTILGSSRGAQPIAEMVDTLVRYGISILFVIGGDGSHRGSMLMAEEVARRKLDIAVIGIPKTIDNDISHIQRSFGFDTAVEEARKAVNAAHVEATCLRNGIGLVKLMGRDAGFIAAHATLASGNVNICLIPEEPFDLEVINQRIRRRLEKKGHLVIVVAEGVGQEFMRQGEKLEYDESGNPRLIDIGPFLKKRISAYLKSAGIPFTIKYIDPSYMIRSTSANGIDSSFCLQLGNYAVHTGMAGRTNTLIGYWNQHFCLVPIHFALNEKKTVDINGSMWRSVLEVTGRY
ncbi:MAG: ATP-dependent 6-phosphofructokinase [Proteobacteria bacterium]|nr:ATP-dependent 6-phosphofructokinase [Pseudomonadota bacterium]MBU1738628.1 ATP-dependent 6-phosphofructokinase [Pseudomonadota bacterium]